LPISLSVLASCFPAFAEDLKRLDVMLENAGIATCIYRKAEDNEATITVNVVSTFLLALMILPKLRETATKYNVRPHLVIVRSDVHEWTTLPEKGNPSIFKALNRMETADMASRFDVMLMPVFP
jgi:retinol dehydrogenase-12